MAKESFSTTFGGYDRGEVDRLVKDLEQQISLLRANNESMRDEIEGLENQVASEKARQSALASKAESLPERLSYTALGPQFEEVLRLAEEKSERLVTDARSEAAKLRSSSTARAAELTREAEERANLIITEADTRSAEMLQQAEATATDVVTQALMRPALATERLAEARRESDEILRAADGEIRESRTNFQRTADEEDAALAELIERTNRERREFEESLRAREQKFARDSELRQTEAIELSNRLLDEAQQKASEINATSSGISAEIDILERTSQGRVDEVLGEARRVAAGILDQAQSQAAKIAELTSDYSDALFERSSGRAELVREERELVNSFLSDITDSRATDKLISQYEAAFDSEDVDGLADGFDANNFNR
ncbi:MAG: DivIVA domain-containing protein [Microbacteriaceae bacterium]